MQEGRRGTPQGGGSDNTLAKPAADFNTIRRRTGFQPVFSREGTTDPAGCHWLCQCNSRDGSSANRHAGYVYRTDRWAGSKYSVNKLSTCRSPLRVSSICPFDRFR